MWYTLALMDLMMVRVDRNMLSYWIYIRHPVIRTQHLLCLTVINKLKYDLSPRVLVQTICTVNELVLNSPSFFCKILTQDRNTAPVV